MVFRGLTQKHSGGWVRPNGLPLNSAKRTLTTTLDGCKGLETCITLLTKPFLAKAKPSANKISSSGFQKNGRKWPESGVQAIIQRDVPAALHVHCASHSLNLALCSSCSVPEIRNAFGAIQEVCSFFRKSGVRSRLLREKISENSDLTKQRLHCLCETRWVECHEAIQTFLELFGVVVLALEDIAEAAVEASPKAHQLLACVLTPTFIVSVNITAKALSLTLALSRQLQTATSDLVVALDLIDHVRLR